MKSTLLSLLLFPLLLVAQSPTFKDGIPADLEKEKIIFLEHESIKVTANRKNGAQEKYLHLRQTNHNRVIEEANKELKVAALKYPYEYAIASPSTYKSLAKAGYKYVLYSQVYKYEFLKTQPKDNELVIFEYYIYDMQNNVAFKVFEADEMKIYGSKFLMKKFIKAIN